MLRGSIITQERREKSSLQTATKGGNISLLQPPGFILTTPAERQLIQAVMSAASLMKDSFHQHQPGWGEYGFSAAGIIQFKWILGPSITAGLLPEPCLTTDSTRAREEPGPLWSSSNSQLKVGFTDYYSSVQPSLS